MIKIKTQQTPAQVSQSQSRKPFVVVAIPHTGMVHMEFTEKVYSALKQNSQYFNKSIITSRGLPIDVTRNQLAKTLLDDKNATHICFIDTDVIPEDKTPNEIIEMLLACNHPIASASYRAHQKTGFHYAAWVKDVTANRMQFIPVEKWTGNWITVDTAGAGFLLIRREVFEKVPPPWFVWDDMTGYPSEDFTATLKFKEYGFTTMVMMDAKCSHVTGKLKVKWDGTVTTCDV